MLFSKIADNQNPSSLASSFRNRRINLLKEWIAPLEKPVRILDIGGTEKFWQDAGLQEGDVEITLLNLEASPSQQKHIKSISGDARDLSRFADKSFDLAFSNSVIEHLFSFENQQKMANEATRVAKFYFIQTPNYWFPIEPHWVFPFFQFLPKFLRIILTRYFNLGHLKHSATWEKARAQVDEIRLLDKNEMRSLFPKGLIWEEKISFLTKSIVAHNFKKIS